MPRPLTRLAALTALVAGLALAGCAAGQTAAEPTAAPSATGSPTTGTPDTATEAAEALDPAVLRPVVALIVERLDTAPQVAASKWFSGQPVTDEAREQVVLDTAAAAAAEAGVDAEWVTAVFADQIAASKEVQQALLDQWSAGTASAPASAPDLATEIRPVLDRITAELVPALGAVQDLRGDPACEAALVVALAEGVVPASGEAAAALATATSRVCA